MCLFLSFWGHGSRLNSSLSSSLRRQRFIHTFFDIFRLLFYLSQTICFIIRCMALFGSRLFFLNSVLFDNSSSPSLSQSPLFSNVEIFLIIFFIFVWIVYLLRLMGKQISIDLDNMLAFFIFLFSAINQSLQRDLVRQSLFDMIIVIFNVKVLLFHLQ